MIYPKKLKRGDSIRVIAPSRSFSIISKECRDISKKRFEDLGLNVSFSKHIEEIDDFVSSSVNSRLEDLHEAFSDKSVDAIFTAIGGFSSNQLIDNIDYEIIKNNPKILCGFSDITCLTHAITSMTDMVTYSGPHYSSFGMLKGFDYTLEYFKKCFFSVDSYNILPSKEYSYDTCWFINQEERNFIPNSNFKNLNNTENIELVGKIIGGHVRCISSLQGTKYWPDLENSVLFLEEDDEVSPQVFDRMLQSIIQQKNFKGVKAILIGRFQNATKMTDSLLSQIVHTKKELNNIPVISNLDIGHTNPIISYPIGGECKIKITNKEINIEIVKH